MKYLKKFEEFDNNEISYAPGDIIYIQYEGVQHTAKIEKVNSKNSFIVHIEINQQFQTPPIKISYDDIIGMAKSNSDPAMNNDIMQTYQNRVSNDLVINGYPKAI